MKTQTDYQRYFLAIIPPEPIFSEAHQLKEYFKEKYNSKASLNSPPHITLHMPFLWKEKKETILLEKLKTFSSNQPPFDLHLQNYNAFAQRVIYIDVLRVVNHVSYLGCKKTPSATESLLLECRTDYV